MELIFKIFGDFVLFYPIVMSIFWIIGTILYFFIIEIKLKKQVMKDNLPGITFIIPCYNEEDTVEDTIRSVLKMSYPNKEIIAVNDGSSDNTAQVLSDLEQKLDFKFLNIVNNKGKAHALNRAAEITTNDYIICIDADTIIEDIAPYYMIERFKNNPTLAAVTGNPRIRNKSTLLGKIQTIEYASMIGSIKRAQTMNGYINTISGVFTLFKREALEKVGYWDMDMITEDIAVSWKFHLHGYHIEYEPRALCWMLVPETLSGLLKQRIRWAQGGHEVLLRDWKEMGRQRNFSFWFLFVEQVLSIIWVYGVVILLALSLIQNNYLDFYYYKYNFSILLYSALLLTFVNIIQFTISLLIDSKYEKKNMWYIFFLVWYPTFYWFLNAFTAIVAFPKALRRKKGEFATWSSPDRGNIQQ
ncbi:poly-beta-1,6-N-acetyl-D-glucosamine synthase [Macrococcus epidermidis]